MLIIYVIASRRNRTHVNTNPRATEGKKLYKYQSIADVIHRINFEHVQYVLVVLWPSSHCIIEFGHLLRWIVWINVINWTGHTHTNNNSINSRKSPRNTKEGKRKKWMWKWTPKKIPRSTEPTTCFVNVTVIFCVLEISFCVASVVLRCCWRRAHTKQPEYLLIWLHIAKRNQTFYIVQCTTLQTC